MKNLFTLSLILLFGLMIAQNSFAIEKADKAVQKVGVEEQFTPKQIEESPVQETIFSKWKHRMQAATDQLLLVIIAILLPPLAVFLLEGLTTNFWIDLLLTLLLYLPGLVFALYLILA